MRLLTYFLLSLIILSGCGSSGNQLTTYSGVTNVFEYHDEYNGLSLESTIEVGQEIVVIASMQNIRNKPIVYNGRCGIPFYISIVMDGAHAHLNTDQEEINCEDIFDPNDLEELPAGEIIEKKVTFYRELTTANRSTTPAFDGEYNVQFSFTTHEKGHFYSDFPLTLTNESEPEILTVEEVIDFALNHDEVSDWYINLEEQGNELKTERAILTDREWVIGFHTMNEEKFFRIIVAIDRQKGTVKRINYEEFEVVEGMADLFDNL